MYENIDEQIEVDIVFLKRGVVLRSFSWGGRVYQIHELSMIHHEWRGREKVYFFSVSDGVNFFRLRFSTDNMAWWLEEMYNDG